MHSPHYNPAGTVSPVIYRPHLEEDADAAQRHPPRTRPSHGDRRLVAHRHEQDPHFSTFHQVLNRARWSPLQASRRLLMRIIETFVPAGGTLDIVIDETLERR